MFRLRHGLLYLTNNGRRKEYKWDLGPALFMVAMVSEKMYAILSRVKNSLKKCLATSSDSIFTFLCYSYVFMYEFMLMKKLFHVLVKLH